MESKQYIRHVHVFREDPVWDTCEKWWKLRQSEVRRLFIVSYQFDDDVDYVGDVAAQAELENPGCVYFY